MTVASASSYIQYAADGVTKTFAAPFYFLLNSDVAVQISDTSGAVTDLVNGTNFSVTGAGNASGGSVTLNVAYAAGYTILVYRNPPITQETVYYENGKFPAKSHEKALDKLTMLIQKFGWMLDVLALKKPSFLAKYYDAKGNRIANLADPVNAQDGTSKAYVDNSDANLQAQISSNFLRTLRVPESGVNQLPDIARRRESILGFDTNGNPAPIYSWTGTADLSVKLSSSNGSGLIGYKLPRTNATKRTVESRLSDGPSLLDYTSDSANDDTPRFVKAIADGLQYIMIPQGKFNVSELTIPSGISIEGRGTMGLNGLGTQLTVDLDAAFGISADSTGNNRPTGGGIFNLSLKCAVAKTGNPDLLRAKSWSYFTVDRVAFENTMGWAIVMQDFMESQITNCNFRAIGSDGDGVILMDDYLGNYSGNNVNNLLMDHLTFGGCSGAWIKSTAKSNPDLIRINDIKFEFDNILSSANNSGKYVIDFLNMARCSITNCGFTYLNDLNNNYLAALHMGPLCSVVTKFIGNSFFGVKSPWVVEGGSLFARDNTSNQANYSTSDGMAGSITSSKWCDAEAIRCVSSNGNTVRGKDIKLPSFNPSHDMSGVVNNPFYVDALATSGTAMAVPASTEIRRVPLPAIARDGSIVVNVTVRVKCQDSSGADSSVTLYSGSTAVSTKTITASKGWQSLSFQVKPTQITTSYFVLTNGSGAAILFDGLLFDKSSYIDWDFSFSPGSISSGGSVNSAVQNSTDFAGISGIIQGVSSVRFDSSSVGLVATVNTVNSDAFSITLTNTSSSSVTPSITRCYVRIALKA